MLEFYCCSDQPSALNSMGSLQRLVNRLYIRRVRLVPRFDVDVKRVLDLYPVRNIDAVALTLHWRWTGAGWVIVSETLAQNCHRRLKTAQIAWVFYFQCNPPPDVRSIHLIDLFFKVRMPALPVLWWRGYRERPAIVPFPSNIRKSYLHKQMKL